MRLLPCAILLTVLAATPGCFTNAVVDGFATASGIHDLRRPERAWLTDEGRSLTVEGKIGPWILVDLSAPSDEGSFLVRYDLADVAAEGSAVRASADSLEPARARNRPQGRELQVVALERWQRPQDPAQPRRPEDGRPLPEGFPREYVVAEMSPPLPGERVHLEDLWLVQGSHVRRLETSVTERPGLGLALAPVCLTLMAGAAGADFALIPAYYAYLLAGYDPAFGRGRVEMTSWASWRPVEDREPRTR